MMHGEFVLPPDQEGRLDKALAVLLPELGLRARRRLWEEGRVLVNGIPRPAGFSVRAGDVICLYSKTAPDTNSETIPPWHDNDQPRLLERHEDWLFLYKPAGLHSAALSGRHGTSLEALLPQLAPDAVLLNRLDQQTSGLVLATAIAQAISGWQHLENAGLCRKSYLALLHGVLERAITVTNSLNTDNRRVTSVQDTEAPSLRHTVITPLVHMRAEDLRALAAWSPTLGHCPAKVPLTLARCEIRKGARHQIRAHAAHAGYPLWGDGRYGEGESENFLLHHGMLCISDLTVNAPCPWWTHLPEKITNNLGEWMNPNNILL